MLYAFKTLYCPLLHIRILDINIIIAICRHVTVNCGSPHAAADEEEHCWGWGNIKYPYL